MELSEKPDVKIEEFWLSVKNVFKLIVAAHDDKKHHTKSFVKIEKWSNILNELQKQKRYDDIERTIEYLLKKVFMFVMKIGARYHFDLLYTQLERWNKTKLVGQESLPSQTTLTTDRIFKYDEYLYVEVLVRVAHVLLRKKLDDDEVNVLECIFEKIDVKIKNNKEPDKIMMHIVDQLIENRKDGCLTYVFKYVNRDTIIKKLYGIELVQETKRGKKPLLCSNKNLIKFIEEKRFSS